MKSYVLIFIIAVLAGIILLQDQCKKPTADPEIKTVTVVKRDTVWQVRDTVIYKDHLVPVASIPQPLPAPSDDCDTMREQYIGLTSNYFAKHAYSDTIRFDSSFIAIQDTLQHNKILNRKYIKHLVLPEVKETVTTTLTQTDIRRQLYAGIGLGGRKTDIVDRFSASLLYKDRKDRMIRLDAGIDIAGKLFYQGGYYWKIRLR